MSMQQLLRAAPQAAPRSDAEWPLSCACRGGTSEEGPAWWWGAAIKSGGEEARRCLPLVVARRIWWIRVALAAGRVGVPLSGRAAAVDVVAWGFAGAAISAEAWREDEVV